jgi:hypothetical protein
VHPVYHKRKALSTLFPALHGKNKPDDITLLTKLDVLGRIVQQGRPAVPAKLYLTVFHVLTSCYHYTYKHLDNQENK